jgi:hypothetical protein
MAIHLRHPTIAPAREPEDGFGVPMCRPFDIQRVVELLDPAVTCKLCPKRYARWLTEHVQPEAELPEEPFVPTGEEHSVREVRGTSTLGERELAAVARSLAGHIERRFQWRSAPEAIRELVVFRADGAGTKSTSKPERFERAPRAGYDHDPTRTIAAQVDRLHGVDVAVSRAYVGNLELTFKPDEKDEDGRRYDEQLVSVTLTAEQQTTMLLWLHEYTLEAAKLESRGRDRVPVTPLMVVRRVRAAWDITLTERQVGIVRNHGLRRVVAHLIEIGELAPEEKRADAPRKEQGETMAVRGFDFAGWKEISSYLGMSERTCERLSDPGKDDPLPVHDIDGVKNVQAKRAELDAWVERNAARRGAGAA